MEKLQQIKKELGFLGENSGYKHLEDIISQNKNLVKDFKINGTFNLERMFQTDLVIIYGEYFHIPSDNKRFFFEYGYRVGIDDYSIDSFIFQQELNEEKIKSFILVLFEAQTELIKEVGLKNLDGQ